MPLPRQFGDLNHVCPFVCDFFGVENHSVDAGAFLPRIDFHRRPKAQSRSLHPYAVLAYGGAVVIAEGAAEGRNSSQYVWRHSGAVLQNKDIKSLRTLFPLLVEIDADFRSTGVERNCRRVHK